MGDGSTTDSSIPLRVNLPVGTTVHAVAAGYRHTLAVTSAGSVAWGYNSDGELGNGTTADSEVPVPVSLPSGVTVTSVAAGDTYSLALTATGAVYAWGSNAYGQLGGGNTGASTSSPVAVALPSGTVVRALAGGARHVLALTSTGSVIAWGENINGALGTGPATLHGPFTVPLPASATVTAVAAGGDMRAGCLIQGCRRPPPSPSGDAA